MNTLDLIVCLVLALAVWNGWRQGFILQVCSLAGIVAGIWLAAQFGTRAVELLMEGKSNRVIGIKENKIIDLDISDALSQKKTIRHDLYDMAAKLC